MPHNAVEIREEDRRQPQCSTDPAGLSFRAGDPANPYNWKKVSPTSKLPRSLS